MIFSVCLREVIPLISGLSFDDLYQKASEVLEIYDDACRTIRDIQIETGLRCLPSCRECCKTSGDSIQVTITEFLPLSLRLWNEGRADDLLRRLEDVSDSDRCILFEGSGEIRNEGGCTEYAFRPLICRLFGFSGVIDRLGRVAPVICKYVKTGYPHCVERFTEKFSSGLEIPVFSDYLKRVQGIDPHMGSRTYSINSALRKALEYVGMRFDYSSKGFDRTA